MKALEKGVMQKMGENLGKYLAPYIDHIEKYYDWEFKEDIAQRELGMYDTGGGSWYQKTIKLKEEVVSQMNKPDSDKELERLVTYYIKDWGGITNYEMAPDDIKNYKSLAGEQMPPDKRFSFKRISSWSKYLSLICPDWACIYDSRVAYSINVINYLSGDYKTFFPLPKGRGAKLNLIGIETLFLDKLIPYGILDKADPEHRQYAANVRRKFHVRKKEVYRSYIELVNVTASYLKLEKEGYHKIEMLLFALAPTTVLQDLIEHLNDVSGVRSIEALKGDS